MRFAIALTAIFHFSALLTTAVMVGPARAEDGQDWANLIDADSFGRWTNTGKRDFFKLGGDGTLSGSGGISYLISPNAYADFELTGRMKVSQNGNGGIFFGVPAGSNLDRPRGYEVQLYIGGDGPGTGSILLDGKPIKSVGGFHVPDRWYSFRIRHQGRLLLVKIDDKEVHNLDDAEHRSGHIALQSYSQRGEVHYADLKIRDLSPRSPGVDTAAAGADAKLEVAKGAPETGSAMRTWTDHTGTRTIQAEFLSSDKQKVKLRLDNGKNLTVRIDQLSDSDQQFVRDAIAASQSPKPATGKPTTPSASSVGDTPAGKEKKVAAKATFAVRGVKPGMTDGEALRIIKSHGSPILQIRRDDSLQVEIGRKLGKPEYNLTYVDEIVTRDGLHVRFCEDLPKRPGIGICYEIQYNKEHDKVARLNPEAAARQLREALVIRYGEPSEEDSRWAKWVSEAGTDNETSLGATWNTSGYGIGVSANIFQLRSNKGAELLRDQALKNLPVPKVELDF
jgi:hypothetical protein